MNLRKFAIVPMLAMSLFAVGCGADCESLCEDRKECDGASEELKKVDCEKSCEEEEKAVEKAGCEDQYDDLLSCASGEDVCKANNTACAKEGEAYFKCMGLDDLGE